MKAYIRVTAILIFHFAAIFASAQQNSSEWKEVAVPWVPDSGYWVVVSNIHTPKFAVVHFYTNDNIEIHMEQIDGIRLNCKRKKVKLILDKVLENALSHQWGSGSKDQLLSVAKLLK